MDERLPGAGRRRRSRPTALDFAVFALVLSAIGYVGYRVESVLVYQWDWSAIPGYFSPRLQDRRMVANLLMKGLATTVHRILGNDRFYHCRRRARVRPDQPPPLLPRLVGWAYVGFIRNIPAVPFLFLFYFFLSTQLMPILGIEKFLAEASPGQLSVLQVLFGNVSLIPNFAAGVMCLSLMMAAYIAEIVRAGIESIPKTQIEAGRQAPNEPAAHRLGHVLPQALQRVVPPLTGQLITLIKDSSLLALISIQELSFLAMEIAISERRFFEVWIVTGLLYFVVCYALSLVMRRLERRAEAKGR